MALLLILFGGVLVVAVAVGVFLYIKSKTPTRFTEIGDCGWPKLTRGWYDFTGSGKKEDYCRFVGDKTNPTFKCKMATGIEKVDESFLPGAKHDSYIAGSATGNWSCPL